MFKSCTRCRWHKNNYVNCVSFDGNPNADIVFCGEAYGKTEALEKEAFVGRAGDILNDALLKIGLDRKDIAIINAIKCYLPGNPTPTPKEMDACFPHVYREIKTINPKLVVAMGASAFYQLTGRTNFENYRGKIVFSDKIGYNVFTIFHPAATIYSSDRLESFLNDFKRIPSLVNYGKAKVRNYDFDIIPSVEEFDKIKKGLICSEHIYLDTETTGLDPFKDEITLLQLGNDSGRIYLIEPYILQDVKEDLQLIFSNTKVVAQNLAFDAKFLYTKLGIWFESWYWDTMIAEYIISGLYNNSLHALTCKYVPDMYGYDEKVISIGGAHNVKTKKMLCEYGANDVGVLRPIMKHQQGIIAKFPKWKYLLHKILIPNSKVLTSMSLRGVVYDIEKVKEYDRIFEKDAEDLLERVSKLESIRECEKFFKRPFNPKSSMMLRWLLLDYYKLPVLKKTKPTKNNPEGNPSVGKEEMEKYAEEYDNEYCKEMIEYRSLEAIRTNFFSGVLPKLHGNVAHTDYSITLTASGRSTSYNPNLLNLISPAKKCIVPRPGYVFLRADQGQVEVRVAAVVYYDKNLINLCNQVDYDFHTVIASRVFKEDYDLFLKKVKEEDEEYVEKRRRSKAITFGILYQQSPESLAYDLGISVKEARKFIDDYFSEFPDLYDAIEKTKEHVIRYGWVESYFGLRRRWKNHSPDDKKTLRDAVNHRIQSTAWQLTQLSLNELYLRLLDKKSRLVMETHDDIVTETYKPEIDEVAHLMKEVMTSVNKPYPVLNEVKLITDVEIGVNSLGERKVYG